MADYNQYINDNMAELGVLPFCLNAMTLLNKSQAEQRLALASYFGTHTDEEICDMFPQFAELKPMFDDGDVDQLKKVCRGKLNGTGGRNGSKGLVKERDEISTRIDTIHQLFIKGMYSSTTKRMQRQLLIATNRALRISTMTRLLVLMR